MNNILKTKWVFIPALLVGVVTVAILIKTQSRPSIVPLKEWAKAVNVIAVPQIDVTPAIKANGTVQPGKVWRGIAEVGGKIVGLHPRLKNGETIERGELLLSIDPTDYELSIAQSDANINAIKAQLAELDIQADNTRALLAIESNSLKLSKNEANRKQKLFKDKSISQADYDKEQRSYLNQQKSYANLQNTLTRLPAQKNRFKAELKKLQAQHATAKHNLQRATVYMPFSGRIAETKVELGQFVRQGELLTIVDGIAKAEITVQVPINKLSQLLRTQNPTSINALNQPQVKKAFDLTAQVSLSLGDHEAKWAGKVTRISETIDLKTRTIGVIVEVKDPYEGIILGVKPPLMKGMYVSVTLRGQPQKNRLTVPRYTLFNLQGTEASIHLVNKDNRLETRSVTTSLMTNGISVISAGLKKGDLVIVSDLVPAIEGMLLKTIDDEKALSAITLAAGANQ